MKTDKIRNYLFTTMIAITLTACGGGSGGSSNDCAMDTKDSDNDGFLDYKEQLDNNAFENGKYSNLENVVNSPAVQRILKIAKERGVDIKLELGNNPPKLTGYNKSETGGRVVYANNSLYNRQTGNLLITTEARLCASKGYAKIVSNSPLSTGEELGQIRGDGDRFSLYHMYAYKHSDGCTAYYVSIENGKIDSKSGDMKNYKVVIAPLGYEEKSQGACAPYQGANRMEEVFTTADWKKVTDLDELEYMCVDGNKAYIPYETWKNSDKQSCKCTTDVEIECN